MATAVTPTIVLFQIITSPCKCSDSLLCQNFNDQKIWPLHKCVRRQFLWVSDLKYTDWKGMQKTIWAYL